MKTLVASAALVISVGLPAVAEAYVGPAAGLGLLAAFWAFIAAVGTVLVFLVAWPVRRLLKRRKALQEADDAVANASDSKHRGNP